MHYLVKNKESF